MTVQHERLHEVAMAFQAIAEVRAAGGYAPIYQQMAAGAGTDPDLLAIAAAAQPGQNRRVCCWAPPNSCSPTILIIRWSSSTRP